MNLEDVLAAKGRRRVVTVSSKSSVADAIRAMHAEKVGAVMVPDAEGCPVGIFTERDVVRLYAEGDRDFDKLPVEARMTCSVVVGRLSMPVDEALGLMTERRFRTSLHSRQRTRSTSLPRKWRASLTRCAAAALASGYSIICGSGTMFCAASLPTRSRCGRSRLTLGRSDVTSERGESGAAAPAATVARRPPGPQHREAPFGDVAAHRIEHRVAVRNQLGEVLRAVVDHLVRAERAHVVVVRRARRRDHARAEVLGERDGEARHPARAALDQDRLARLQLERFLERDQRRQARERDRRRLRVAQAFRLARHDLLADGDLLRVRALARHLAHAEHRVADLEVVRALA